MGDMSEREPGMWKVLYWELKNREARLIYLMWMVRSIPGEFGFLLRRRLLSGHFGSCGQNVMIHPGVKFRNIHKLIVGNDVYIGEDAFIQAGGEVTLGNSVLIGPGVKIWTQNHEFGDTGPVSTRDYNYAKVDIGDDVWIGANAFIMPGVSLQRGTIVSAGSVVGAKVYPAYCVIGGNPARVVKLRRGESDTQKEGSTA